MEYLKFMTLGLIICVLSSCANSNQSLARESSPLLNTSRGNLDTLEKRIAAQVRTYRVSAGLTPMNYDPRMANIARTHSEKLKRKYAKTGKRMVNHDGFGSRANKVILKLSISETAENVAYVWGGDSDVSARLSRNWMKSPVHKKNILKKWNYTGIGAAVASDGTVFATQVFGLKTDFTF